ncbi:T9SS type B sorting domain-containing protein [Aquimarina sediminis]|uniref:T9SS type B sorting domain-containing protein n=1 Tax=Aquimarina sediminis TaxID=2070536 RepID=UPI0013E89D98|nr:gliding motility-associated C-terminal domain-containing protein [Aquimarina sediminis]
MGNIKKHALIFRCIGLFIFFCLISNSGKAQQLYPANFDVTTLNGTNGFVIPGMDTTYKLGYEMQFIGDINNDGLEDVCLGNGEETVMSSDLAGRAYIIFGSTTGFPTPFDLTTLNGTNGFVVEGVGYNQRRGSTVAGPGDINGDGIDDLIVGSSNSSADEMVIYGSTTFSAVMDVNDINGTNGFLIDTPGSNQVAVLGDVNGDGINDFIIGTPHWSGQAWIVFGRSTDFPALINVSWLNGVNGFRTSQFPGSRPSYNVGGAGDINNDGYNDIMIGNWGSSFDVSGEISYVLFGKGTPFDPIVDLVAVDGTDGFKVDNGGNGFLTFVGSIGDVNGDGIDDCFSENNIILGSTNPFSANLLMSDLDGSNGFVLNNYVLCAAPTGDLNLDGIDDFIVAGADNYVVFGTSGGFSASFDSSTLNGVNGFNISVSNSNIGRPIDGGKDMNGDGLTDFIFGDRNGASGGSAYVIFGGDHYAMPLNSGYPQAINETISGFTLVVNGPETGRIHYAIFPGNFSATVSHDDITGGVGSVVNGSFLMNIANTDIQEVISSLAAATTYDVYLFLEDGVGNQGEIYHIDNVTTLSGIDTIDPTASNPISVDVQCSADIPAPNPLVVTDEADNSGVLPTVAFVQDVSNGLSNPEVITRTYSVTDGSGNSINVTQTIVVNDTIDPTASNPTTITVACFEDVPPVDVSVVTSKADNCTANPTVSFISQNNSNPTMVTRIYNVSDEANNRVSVTHTILITDTIDPTASNPAGITVPCITDVPVADIEVVIDEADNCTVNPIVTYVGDVNTSSNIITRTYSVADSAGNSINVTQIITISDTVDPILDCPTDQVLVTGAVIPDYTGLVVATYNCDSSLGIIQNPVAGSPFTDDMTIEFTVTDVSGNIGRCSITITATTDTEAPKINCPSDQELSCDATILPDYRELVVVTDNQDANPNIIQNPVAGSPIVDGMLITITATDFSTNSSSCAFAINQEEVSVQVGEDEEIMIGQEIELSSVASTNGNFVWTPSTGLNNANITNPVASPDQTTTYTVLFTNDQGCIAEDMITVYVEAQPEDLTRYGFSPDGDGINEYWEIYDIENYPNNKVSIYNRWGDIVFEIKGYNNTSKVFRGIANKKRNIGGDKLPEGTYFFDIKIEGSHNLRKQTGFLVLKR